MVQPGPPYSFGHDGAIQPFSVKNTVPKQRLLFRQIGLWIRHPHFGRIVLGDESAQFIAEGRILF